jgi:hypothetical protein
MNKTEINEIRKVMGTASNQATEKKTSFLKGVEGITVDLIDYNVNPYKSMYVMATSCWGKKIDKWADTTPQMRFEVVKAVLERQALPLALEAPTFTFVVEGLSRAAFDQLARSRVGIVFSAKGMRDNDWSDCDFRIPTELWPEEGGDVDAFKQLGNTLLEVKDAYVKIVEQGKGSWQSARTVLPLYTVYGYSTAVNYNSLKGICANRMKFCEMEDTCAVAWLMAKEVSKVFPLLGSYLRPGCDFTGKCQYHSNYALSEMFGCLFSECGRNTCENTDGYAEFNKSCTDVNVLKDQLGLEIPEHDGWPKFETFDDLSFDDKYYFVKE